jgi:hypothetical protein
MKRLEQEDEEKKSFFMKVIYSKQEGSNIPRMDAWRLA